MHTGIKNEVSLTVDNANTAKAMGSGELDVFATPAMIALMEKTASESIKQYLDEDTTSVGTKIEIEHISATPIGMKVRCESFLAQIDGKRLVFEVSAFDECCVIGKGIHERFLVKKEKFTQKTYSKLKKE